MTTLLENEYCKIVEDSKGNWYRIDKILKTQMRVDSYFSIEGNHISN